jgi:hypothetical protein
MRATIPQYESLDGLSYKAFSIEQNSGKFGGVYYWRDRQTANAWYNPEWVERVTRERGAAPEVMIVDAPVALDNTPDGETASDDFDGVATLVTIPIPDAISRDKLVEKFKEAAPTYQKIDGLMRKYFIITDDGKFGGVYLWRDQASADAWFTPAWAEQVKNLFGRAATLEWFDIPVLTPTKLQNNRLAVMRP